MKIVIIGDGKVGFTLTQQLAKEGHDIVIVDNKPSVLKKANDMLDVIGIQGNGISVDVQKEAGVADADLLIAVTSTDDVNILSCLLAKNLGAKKTIARVRDPEYLPTLALLRDNLGLSMVINPELAAAREIYRNLQFPSAMKVETLSKGRVELVEFKVFENSPIINMSLKQLNREYKEKLLVCAVERNKEIYIPDGNFVIEENDKITIHASRKDIMKFFKKINIKTPKMKNIMIVGGSKIAYYLTQFCNSVGIDVKIIDMNPDKCQELSELLHPAMIIQGDGSDHEIMIEEGIQDVDAFIALTGMDEENIIISMYANLCGVNKVITKVNRSNYEEIMDHAGIPTFVSPKNVTANQIIQYVRALQNSYGSNVSSMTRIVHNSVEALEFKVRSNFNKLNIPLKEFTTKQNLLLATIIRNGKVIIPSGDDVIMENDSVVVITTISGLQDLNDILA